MAGQYLETSLEHKEKETHLITHPPPFPLPSVLNPLSVVSVSVPKLVVCRKSSKASSDISMSHHSAECLDHIFQKHSTMRQQVKDGVQKNQSLHRFFRRTLLRRQGFATAGLRNPSLRCWLLSYSFSDACVWLEFPRYLALETQNLTVKTFSREVPELRAAENFNINSKFRAYSAADT